MKPSSSSSYIILVQAVGLITSVKFVIGYQQQTTVTNHYGSNMAQVGPFYNGPVRPAASDYYNYQNSHQYNNYDHYNQYNVQEREPEHQQQETNDDYEPDDRPKIHFGFRLRMPAFRFELPPMRLPKITVSAKIQQPNRPRTIQLPEINLDTGTHISPGYTAGSPHRVRESTIHTGGHSLKSGGQYDNYNHYN